MQGFAQKLVLLSFMLLSFVSTSLAQESYVELKDEFLKQEAAEQKRIDDEWRPFRLHVELPDAEGMAPEVVEPNRREAPEDFEIPNQQIEFYEGWVERFATLLDRTSDPEERLKIQLDLLYMHERLFYFSGLNEAAANAARRQRHITIYRLSVLGSVRLLCAHRAFWLEKKGRQRAWLDVYQQIDPEFLSRPEVDLLAVKAAKKAYDVGRDAEDELREYWLLRYQTSPPQPEPPGMRFARLWLTEYRAVRNYYAQIAAYSREHDKRFAGKKRTPEEVKAFIEEMRQRGIENPADDPPSDQWLDAYASWSEMADGPLELEVMSADFAACRTLNGLALARERMRAKEVARGADLNPKTGPDHEVAYYTRRVVELYAQLLRSHPAHRLVGEHSGLAVSCAQMLDARDYYRRHEELVGEAVQRSFHEHGEKVFDPKAVFSMTDRAKRKARRTREEADRLAALEICKYLIDTYPSSRFAGFVERTVQGLAIVKAGDPAPSFTATAFTEREGKVQVKQVSLEELRGKVVLFDPWFIGCNGCRLLFPTIAEIHRDFSGREDFVLLGVFDGQQGKTTVNEHMNKINLWSGGEEDDELWWQIDDSDTEPQPIKKLYGISSWPTTILIDRNGTVVARGLRYQELYDKVKEELGRGE